MNNANPKDSEWTGGRGPGWGEAKEASHKVGTYSGVSGPRYPNLASQFKLAAFLSLFMCVFRKEEKRWSYLRVIEVEMKYENTCKNTN